MEGNDGQIIDLQRFLAQQINPESREWNSLSCQAA